MLKRVFPVLLLACALAHAAEARFVLEKVVIVERHGVRAPTTSPEKLAKYADDPWPQWPVGPGELTAHGAQGVMRMGKALRRYYGNLGVLPKAHCPGFGRLYVYADNADERTRDSGKALIAGLAAGCGVEEHLAAGETRDPLFHTDCPVDSTDEKAVLETRMAALLSTNAEAYDDALRSLQNILTPNRVCTAGTSCLADQPNVLEDADDGVRLRGPLATGSTLAENIYLEYAEAMPRTDVGWNRVTRAKIAAIMRLHALYSDLMRRTPIAAARNGSRLAQEILDVLGGRSGAEVSVSPQATFVAFVGHDTNIANLAGMLGADWTLAHQPDQTAPGLALAFELWRDAASGHRWIKLAVFYQTLDGLRRIRARTDLPIRQTVNVPACQSNKTGFCPAGTFLALLARAVDLRCLEVKPVSAPTGR